MTFSLLARDESGAIGSVIASSSPSVAARCVFLRDGVGGSHSQNITDPRLGGKLLELVKENGSAKQSLKFLLSNEPNLEYRQLLVIDNTGGTAVHSGAKTLGIHASHHEKSLVAAGNMLANAEVIRAMVSAFASVTGDMEWRLVTALAAAVEAGGEAGPIHSAAVNVIRGVGWRVSDVRVDYSENPVAELTELVKRWMPQRDDYVKRALDPSTSPSYGVPGDE